MENSKPGFIGGGFMAEAVISGLIGHKHCVGGDITVSDASKKRLEYLRERYGVKTEESNVKVASESDVLILAVKPQIITEVIDEISRAVREGCVVVSVAAGVTTSSIEAIMTTAKIVRAMPNMCAQVGEAMTAICGGRATREEDVKRVVEIFDCVGKTVLVDESLMDAVTGISGSGPAYIFLVMEAMIQAGVEAGLPPEKSRLLVLQTIKGSAEMAIKTGQHPAILKERIMSPNGTTTAALREFEEYGVRAAFLSGVASAVERSRELGRCS